MVVGLSLLETNDTTRRIYAYDTFEGMSRPTQNDYGVVDGVSPYHFWKNNARKDHNEWCYSDLSEVKKNVLSTGYPEERVVFVKGKVEETIPKTIPSRIALLRLDTD